MAEVGPVRQLHAVAGTGDWNGLDRPVVGDLCAEWHVDVEGGGRIRMRNQSSAQLQPRSVTAATCLIHVDTCASMLH